MDDSEHIITGTGKWYATINKNTGAVSGKINVNDDVASKIQYPKGQKLVITYNEETLETCIKPYTLKY